MAKRALVVAFALVAVACSASERDAALKSQATAPGAAAAVGHDRSTVLALLSGGARTALARLDARTLRPIGRRIEVGGGGSQAFSPNRRTLVVASAVVSGPSAERGRSLGVRVRSCIRAGHGGSCQVLHSRSDASVPRV